MDDGTLTWMYTSFLKVKQLSHIVFSEHLWLLDAIEPLEEIKPILETMETLLGAIDRLKLHSLR